MFSNRRAVLLRGLACVTVLVAGCAALRPGNNGAKSMAAHVVSISNEYKNINTDLSGERLAAGGIIGGSTFRALLRDRSIDVFLGTGYADVDRDEWVGMIEEDGTLQIAVSFGHAATVLGCAVGDTLYIAPSNR
jgi:S-adenosylmethionine hydrolase